MNPGPCPLCGKTQDLAEFNALIGTDRGDIEVDMMECNACLVSAPIDKWNELPRGGDD